MHHILCKTLLLLSILLAIVAIATPDWQVMTFSAGSGSGSVGGSANMGLFKSCQSGSVGGQKDIGKGCSSSFGDDATSAGKARKSCQGLAISAIVFLTLSLACDFIPLNEFQHCRLIGAGSFALGVILLIACIALYADKVHKGSGSLSGVVTAKSGYGYSFYLAVASLLLALGAGAVGVVARKGEHGGSMSRM